MTRLLGLGLLGSFKQYLSACVSDLVVWLFASGHGCPALLLNVVALLPAAFFPQRREMGYLRLLFLQKYLLRMVLLLLLNPYLMFPYQHLLL